MLGVVLSTELTAAFFFYEVFLFVLLRPSTACLLPPPSALHGPHHKQLELLAAQRSLQGRRELLEQACLSHTRKRRVLSPEDLKHLIVDDKHSLIYCYVPKVGYHYIKLVQLKSETRGIQTVLVRRTGRD